MKLAKAQQKILLFVLLAVLVLINGYFYVTGDKPKTAPLTHTRGTTVVSPVRQGLSSRIAGSDPLNVFLEQRVGKFPEVVRDIFLMDNPVPKPKVLPKKATLPPPPPVKTPEEIAAEAASAAEQAAKAATEAAAQAARADMMKFQFLGYLTDKDSTLFLSKEGELFTVKKGSKLLKSYQVKDATEKYVVLLDSITGVEVKLVLPGSEMSKQPDYQQQPPPLMQRRRYNMPETSAGTGTMN